MDLSVLMCTWNNCRRLAMTLEALARCAIPKGIGWEVVLVNNHCTDATDEVARVFQQRFPLRYVMEPEQGMSRARNAGLRAASGRLLVFTDDDVMPYRDWLCVLWFAYQEKPSGYFLADR